MSKRQSPTQLLLLLASLLVLPLALLLFAQWPLRDWLQAGSQLANDAAQILFAVYVAVAVTAASLANAHLVAGQSSTGVALRNHRWRATLLLLCVGPWVLFMLWAALPLISASVSGLERFGETMNPGYFVIKLALGLLLLLVLLQALTAWVRAWRHTP
jgi:hypothetical protein